MKLTYLLNLDTFDNPYDATGSLMSSPFLSSDVSETTFSNWDTENNFGNFENYQPLTTIDDDSWGSHATSVCSSTAVNKPLNITPYEGGVSHWQSKPVDQWNPVDTVNWVMSVAHENHLDCEDIHKFQSVDGYELIRMSEARFICLEPTCGSFLYRAMRALKFEQGISPLDPLDMPAEDLMQYTVERPEFKNTVEHPHCTQEPVDEQIQPKIKRSPGRPRIPGRRNKKQEKKTGRLWEFIRDLLLKPEYCPSLICWEDHDQGIFRFVHSEKVARLWGTIKENPKMTYEKLSRAMRYYYRSKVLQPVLGRRLVYKFGPTATGWRTSNPNFRNKDS